MQYKSNFWYLLVLYMLGICDYVLGQSAAISDLEKYVNASLESPQNNNNSIQYLLYTPSDHEYACYSEPEDTNKCSFDPSLEIKILIHGFKTKLLPGNLFEQIKNTLLVSNNYNVIIVNWTKYNRDPYNSAVYNSYLVGIKVGEIINFLVSNRSVNSSDVHIIGHSLGAHAAGVAGKHVCNVGRVTALDPAGPLYIKLITAYRLTNDSANFVDGIHTSNFYTGIGYGMPEPIGTIDFYPNGGNKQPACQTGGKFRTSDGEVNDIKTPADLATCYHDIVLMYFKNSIEICYYRGVKCSKYEKYTRGKCNRHSNPADRMGFHCMPIPGLPAESKFYLKTSSNSPYC